MKRANQPHRVRARREGALTRRRRDLASWKDYLDRVYTRLEELKRVGPPSRVECYPWEPQEYFKVALQRGERHLSDALIHLAIARQDVDNLHSKLQQARMYDD